MQLPDGRTMMRVARYEAFFHPSIIHPQDAADLYLDSSELRIDGVDAKEVQPTCEVSAKWVQFEDGTTFGELSYAKELLQERREIWNALRHLRDIYTQQGESALATALGERVSSSTAEAYLEHLRMFQKQHGTAAVVGRLEEHLRMAELRSSLLPDADHPSSH
jgi:hypothetical protein